MADAPNPPALPLEVRAAVFSQTYRDLQLQVYRAQMLMDMNRREREHLTPEGASGQIPGETFGSRIDKIEASMEALREHYPEELVYYLENLTD